MSVHGALENLVVLDLTRVLAGPLCGALLGDLGATVIKIEVPGRGDDARAYGPYRNGESMVDFAQLLCNRVCGHRPCVEHGGFVLYAGLQGPRLYPGADFTDVDHPVPGLCGSFPL